MQISLKHVLRCAIIILEVLLFSNAYSQQVIITPRDTIYFDAQPDEDEYAILVEFYEKTNGKKWKKSKNWLKGKTSADMAKWQGVVIRDGDVSEINLDDNGLQGEIPKSLYKLVRLTALSVDGNALTEQPTIAKTPSSARMAVSSSEMMRTTAASSVSTASPVIAGRNLPMWGLAVKGPRTQSVDWRTTPPVIGPIQGSSASNLGSSGVGIDDCGRLAFYILHSGNDAPNQLHIYAANGTRLTNTVSGDPKQGLSSANGNIELQVVRVPNTADEWFIIYSLYQTPCGQYPPGSVYCPAKVVYARVRFNAIDGLTIPADKRQVPISPKTFIQGKAVSKTVNGDSKRHYLYLAERASGSLILHRYIIDQVGINFGTQSAVSIPAAYWSGSIAGSSVELSPDEQKLAISNRNVGSWYTQDIIIFDLQHFNSSTYQPTIISIPSLIVSGTGKTIKQLSTEAQYRCFGDIKNKISQIEFSPSGRYLYATHGGYPENTGGKPYHTYLLQIDLQSGSGTQGYTVRMRIEKAAGVTATSCTGSGAAFSTTNFIQQIQSAYDGRIYFTKANSPHLFVIPQPDDPMDHSLEPGVIDFATSAIPNLTMNGNAPVLFMPENIDGHVYIKGNEAVSSFSVDNATPGLGGSVTLTIAQFVPVNTYQVSWGDGVTETVTTATPSHTYNTQIGKHKITLAVINPQNCISVSFNEITVLDCVAMDGLQITGTQYLCAMKFSVPKFTDCYATYLWDFGDGTFSRNRSPMHAYNSAGTYNVKVTIAFDCHLCRSTLTFTKTVSFSEPLATTEQRQLQIPTDRRPQIISSGATTFSETWPLDHNAKSLENINPFVSGAQGVWRNEGSFVYNTPRLSSTPVNLKTDGTYDLEVFNWQYAALEAIPKWVKTNTMNLYNAFGFELENKDVLGVHSAALYDHEGQLQSAHGVNMRNEEMAFTDFEPFDTRPGYEIRNKKPTGNFVFSKEALPQYETFRVPIANSYICVVDAKLADLQHVDKADITMKLFVPQIPFAFPARSLFMPDVKIVCRKPYPDNPDWTVLVFENTPYEGLWMGSIRIKNTVVNAIQGTIDGTVAHTGKNSLKIDSEKVFEQKLIQLEAGKNYEFNAWVSIKNPHVVEPKLSNKLGVDVILKNKEGATVSTTFIVPEGKVIEGWQQVKGIFQCPDKDLLLSLRFRPGSTGTAWYDDIRLHPENGNMKSYVYDITNYRLSAILDENNFASMFFYDKEGNLYLTKKETEEGIKTITENVSYQVEREND